ncbi:hypothetical protein [Alteromonas sp. RKMC-009]|uniref:hypothetical protein n=1 Tax=Alteromonas sp. RKMC-009 TaxID=2267264 RepID=UPI000E679797|nr:hypothetical protein [Alteromonas sp. RKMC-009]AYA64295.1 hypothetical protein DS731_09970 [Alteromonas sp. RKMC-009]
MTQQQYTLGQVLLNKIEELTQKVNALEAIVNNLAPLAQELDLHMPYTPDGVQASTVSNETKPIGEVSKEKAKTIATQVLYEQVENLIARKPEVLTEMLEAYRVADYSTSGASALLDISPAKIRNYFLVARKAGWLIRSGTHRDYRYRVTDKFRELQAEAKEDALA